MSNSALIFDISELLNSSTGTRENYSISGDFSFEDFEEAVSVDSKVEIMRIEKGFNVSLQGFVADVEMRCSKCLCDFTAPISFDGDERQFHMEEPEQVGDPQESFLVDTKAQKIDITDMLRQEIILHLPLIPVCSDNCKGICYSCGTNLNKKQCDCVIVEPHEEHKPFSQLKDLLK